MRDRSLLSGLLLIAVLLGNIAFSVWMWVNKYDIGWFLVIPEHAAEPKQVKIGIENAAAISFPARTSHRH
jgi:hypothetical protein